jgi:hypothetical protein
MLEPTLVMGATEIIRDLAAWWRTVFVVDLAVLVHRLDFTEILLRID